MSVGNQTNKASNDASLTDLAVTMRDLMTRIKRLDTQTNGQGGGLAYLQTIGYSNAANPANPGGQSDAAWALQAIAYLNTLAGVYFGTATQGSTFAFDNALSLLWSGQLG
jgi:hypothetical protein